VRLKRERNQAFGAGHLIDILRGASNDRIRKMGHELIATYGIGEKKRDAYGEAVLEVIAGH
jgi:ATP-dependent DNA helicase RecQ